MTLFKKAERKKLKLRLAIAGPSGSGKTYSALRIAQGLLNNKGRVAVVDTENESASYYSENFDFDCADLKPPYTPERFIEYLQDAEQSGYDCVIIDSISHEWQGAGGALDILSRTPGKNDYTKWNAVTPRHEKFLMAILHSPVHVIVTMRSKTKYELQQNHQGKQVPVKLGMAPIQRADIEYEFTAFFELDRNNHAVASKDRTQMFPPDLSFLPDEKTGEQLAEWLAKGKASGIKTVREWIVEMYKANDMSVLQSLFTEINTQKRNYSRSEMDQLTAVKDEMKAKLQSKTPPPPSNADKKETVKEPAKEPSELEQLEAIANDDKVKPVIQACIDSGDFTQSELDAALKNKDETAAGFILGFIQSKKLAPDNQGDNKEKMI